MARKAPTTKKNTRQILAVERKIKKATDSLKVLQCKLEALNQATQTAQGTCESGEIENKA